MPLPPQIARDNLRRLSERLRRRRARARETILYDLHQGVKSVEAQVHRQVEMVLSRLKEAPGSRYAFALTNSLLSQIPIAASLLPSLPSVGDGPSQVENPEDQKRIQERERHRAAAESLSNEFDSIALAGRPDRYIDSPPASSISPSSSSSQPEGEHQVSISRSGASEFLSASMHTSYSTAASQVLSAALPSFIPSMVAPLVCVFSYPAPSSSSLTMNPGDPESAQQQQQQKDFVFPWGLPNRPPPPYHSPLLRRVQTGQTEERLQQQQGHPPMSTTNSGIDVVHSKFWTQAEREALHLAATRFRLAGQWSKIREMMNLHRTDEEIEGEYVKLYGHRTGIKDYDEDEDDEIENQSGRDENRRKKGDRMEEDRFGSMDGDADDEAEFGGGTLFVKLGGSRRSMASHPHPHPPPPPPHYHHLQQPQQQQQRQLQQQQVQESSSTGALRTGYELQPIVDSQQRLVVIHEPTWMHKNDHMTDKQFALEEIPMRL
ncbi:hypothetical protein BGZ58_005191 [Dissophora ornata]|nr:hypothetical protein BGZ58_005191 [Dissophora ornata]